MLSRLLCRVKNVPRVESLRMCSIPARERDVIGCREVVGPGLNNRPVYFDRPDFPCPAIRFLADNPYMQALREKERGDWRSLTYEEKKCLYRASFCQTFAEMRAPTGEWKSIVGMTLFFLGVAIWMEMGVVKFVLNPLPESCSEERQRAQLKRMLDMQVNPIEGLASRWDYEKEEWKETGWF